MDRLVTFLVALVVFWAAATAISRAAVKSVDELSALQISALQQSDQRLEVFQRRLQVLDHERATKEISGMEYTAQSNKLVALIQEETQFQKAVLLKQSTFREHSLAVLRTIGKLSVGIPLALLTGILKAGGSFSP